MMTSRILIVDDDQTLLQALPEAMRLRLPEATVDTCDSAAGALRRLSEQEYDAIVSDIKMPGMDGLTLLGHIRQLQPDTPTLLVTGHGEHDLAIQALRGGAYDFIQKPIERDYFFASLNRAIQVRQLRRTVEDQRCALEQHAVSLEGQVKERTRELLEANAQKDQMLAARDQALADAERAKDRLAFLAKASTTLNSSLDISSVLSNLAQLCVPEMADWCLVHVRNEGEMPREVASAVTTPEAKQTLQRLKEAHALDMSEAGGFAHVFETGESRLIARIEPKQIRDYAQNARHLELIEQLAPQSYMAVPMRSQGRVMGVITFLITTSGRTYGPDDLALAEELARRAALAAENARLYDEAQRATEEEQRARKRAESLALLSSKQAAQLDAIFQSMVDGVYVADTSGRLVRVNQSAYEQTGLTGGELFSVPISELGRYGRIARPDDTDMPWEEYPLVRALRGESGNDLGMIVYQPNRTLRMRFSFAPVRAADGEIVSAVAVGHDVTELERLQRQKDEFLSIASHELKTPLTSLKGLTQLTRRRVERGGVPVDTHLERMEQAILRMEKLINDLLDVSRIESGKLALTPERVDLRALCEQSADEQMAATERTIVLDMPSEPVEAVVDTDRIGQVLTNLLSNATKYSRPEDPVTLSLTVEGESALFSVRDEGPGIPKQELQHLFERFYRVPGIDVQSGSALGLGLGLYISSEIVERHGGRIWAESELGKGSKFSFAIPLMALPFPAHPSLAYSAQVSEVE